MNQDIARYKNLLEQHPDSELARFSLGKAYFDEGRIREAKEQFEFATATKPDWMVAQILLGKCELALDRRTEAKAAFLRAKELAIAQNHQVPLSEMEQLLADL